eukprot:snap_masked-scaffold_28-processed-gene-0.5-mRNA-1 protein AED:1.00 eAED:1.00 QI:0/0/0/0/1/1/2/0/248
MKENKDTNLLDKLEDTPSDEIDIKDGKGTKYKFIMDDNSELESVTPFMTMIKSIENDEKLQTGKRKSVNLFNQLTLEKNNKEKKKNKKFIIACFLIYFLLTSSSNQTSQITNPETPTTSPISAPTYLSTKTPSSSPSYLSTNFPSTKPTFSPTATPTFFPSDSPSKAPTEESTTGENLCYSAESSDYRYCLDEYTLQKCDEVDGVIVPGKVDNCFEKPDNRHYCRCPDGELFNLDYGCSMEKNVGDCD